MNMGEELGFGEEFDLQDLEELAIQDQRRSAKLFGAAAVGSAVVTGGNIMLAATQPTGPAKLYALGAVCMAISGGISAFMSRRDFSQARKREQHLIQTSS